jgi:hypothetical protein
VLVLYFRNYIRKVIWGSPVKTDSAHYQRRFEVVLFWTLDRFSREGVTETLNHLQRLTATSVQFKSFTEQYLDSTGMFREAIIGFLAAIAKQERVRFSERIKAGPARSSKTPGRPALADDVVAELCRPAKRRSAQLEEDSSCDLSAGGNPAQISRKDLKLRLVTF